MTAPACWVPSGPAGCWSPSGTSTPSSTAADYEDALAGFMERYAAALASDATRSPPEERRARSGLLSRQVTLR